MMIRRLPARARACALLAVPIMLNTCGDNANDTKPFGTLEIKALSNRADMVSGGDVLVEIVVPDGAPDTGLHVALGSDDVTSWFSRGSDGRTLGVVSGLSEGTSTITADVGGKGGAALTITNHKIGGP